MGLTLVTPATASVVTLDEVKLQARELGNAYDQLLEAHIATAQAQVEQLTGRCLAPQTWKLVLDGFSAAIKLPKGPVTGVSSVQYVNALGVLATADPTLYTLDMTSDPQWIVLDSDAVWPTTLDAVNTVEITFTAGYDGQPIPEPILAAIRALAVHWLETAAVGTVPDHVRSLLFPFTAHGF